MSRSHRIVCQPPLNRQAGLTLIEALTAILVLGVIVGLGGPSFIQFVQNARLETRTTTVLQLINQARAEAAAQRRTVVVCGSQNGQGCSNDDAGWSVRVISFIDCNNDGVLSAPVAAPACSDRVLSDIENGSPNVTTTLVGFGNAKRFAFNTQGFLTPATGGTILFCDSRGDRSARAWRVPASGRLTAAIDTDNPADGVVNDLDEANIDCP